jgi:hypothetical protein
LWENIMMKPNMGGVGGGGRQVASTLPLLG